MFCTGYCRTRVWDTHLGSKKTKSSHPRASRTYTLVPIMYSCKADFVFIYLQSKNPAMLHYNFQSPLKLKRERKNKAEQETTVLLLMFYICCYIQSSFKCIISSKLSLVKINYLIVFFQTSDWQYVLLVLLGHGLSSVTRSMME